MSTYAEPAHSLTSKSSKYNVYQTDGKPLSTEAIYRAKLKYGIYNNPAKVSLGVDPSASDTAAVLAANTDLSISGYSKELSSEAAHAALIAKPNSITGWKRTNVAPEAEYAAISVRSLKFPFDSESTSSTMDHESSSEYAAASVLGKNPKFIARDSLQEIYDFDDVRSGKATLSQFSNIPNSKSAKSLNSKKDYRSGVMTSNNAAEQSRKMNIGNISKTASQSADKLLNKRMTPEKNFRSGIKTNSSTRLPNTDASFYIQNIHNQAIKASQKELNKKTTRSMGLQTPSDSGLIENPSNFAASALKLDPTKGNFKSTIKENTLVTQDLYAIATQKANKEINKLNDDVAEKNMYNIKATEMAYKIAQENAAKRKAKDLAPGDIRLGGGLTMKFNDVEKIASTLVTPAISDMETRIVEMKALDAERKQLPAKIRQRNMEHKEELRQAQIALEKKRAEEAKARRDQLVIDKKALDDEHEKFKSDLSVVLNTRQEEFDQQVEEEESEKKKIDDERAEKLKVLNDAKAEKDQERQTELDNMQAEKDADIAPLLEELEVENSKLSELTADREEKEKFFNEEKSKTDAIQSELDDTLSKIEIMNQRIAELEAGLSEVTEQEAAETSAALAAETKLNSEGKEKETKLINLSAERTDLESKREELHKETAEKADELKNLALSHHAEESEINEVYPEHLRKEIIEPEDFNDDDLADSKFELDDTPISIPPEIEDEPESIPEEVWPKVEEPEPEPESEEAGDDAGDGAFAKAEARPLVQKKTWEEIREGGYDGGDPLADVPTQEKPPMADIVDDAKIRASEAATSALKSSKPVKAAGGKVVTGGKPTSVQVIKSDKKGKGFFGFFNKTKAEPTYIERTAPVDTSEAKKKFKGLQEETPKKEAVEVEAPKEVEKKTAATAANDDDDRFSGFSQGSADEE